MDLNKFPHLFTCRLRVYNPVFFSASAKNAAACAVQGPAGSTHPYWIPLSLIFYLNKYHVWCDDAPPGGFLCDSPLAFRSGFPINFKVFLDLLIPHSIKIMDVALENV